MLKYCLAGTTAQPSWKCSQDSVPPQAIFTAVRMATQLVHSLRFEEAFKSAVNLQEHEYYYPDLLYADMKSNSHDHRQNPTRTQRRNPAIKEVNQPMICRKCFDSKGEIQLQKPCQQPQCHFYQQSPQADHERNSFRRDATASASSFYAHRPTFNKQVGHDRHSKFTAQMSHPSQPSTSCYQMWANPPVSPLGSGSFYSPYDQQNERHLKTISHAFYPAGKELDNTQQSSSLLSDEFSFVQNQQRVNQHLEYDCERQVEFVPTTLPNPSGVEPNHKESGSKVFSLVQYSQYVHFEYFK